MTVRDKDSFFIWGYRLSSGSLSKGSLYNAATFFVYANDSLWQKLCFEHGDHGEHHIVSVRTIGTSDDNNYDVVDSAKSVYFKNSSFLHRHFSVVSHFLCKGVFAMLLDIMDAGRSVAVEQDGKQLSDKVVVNLAFLHILVTFGACVKAFPLAALPYLAP